MHRPAQKVKRKSRNRNWEIQTHKNYLLKIKGSNNKNLDSIRFNKNLKWRDNQNKL